MRLWVQCATNFSEGRNQEHIQKIIEPLQNKAGFHIASLDSDPDYHRSVVTLIGDIEAMYRPLLQYVDRALECIDMEHHQGQHFRMGAVDVIPFVPLLDTPISKIETITHLFGRDLGEKMPVYYYAHSTKNVLRKRLPDIRRGGYEGLKLRIRDPLWTPDEGYPDDLLHRGAVALGVRDSLIAYNISLNTIDIKAAHALAKQIRETSGGLPHVQASAVYLESRHRCQVTINLLNYVETPLHLVFETVKALAPTYGVKVKSSELIGLMPLALLDQTAYFYEDKHMALSVQDKLKIVQENLMLENFSVDKIIESHLPL